MQRRRGARPEPGLGLGAEVGVRTLQGLSTGLGLLPSGGGRSPRVGAGVGLAESSWREELCETGRVALAFIRSGRPARQRTEWSPTQTGTFLAFLPTFLPHQLTPD